YMSVVVIVIEIWMIISLMNRWFTGDTTRPKIWYIEHFIWYTTFLLSALLMLIFALLFLRGRVTNRVPGKIIMAFFSFVALYFGMSVSYSDYSKGEQILCFVMMIIFVMGLINWRPIVSIILSASVFKLFYYMMEHAPDHPVSYATKVNYFTLWISIVMLSLSVYSQRLSEAEKDESLEYSSIRDELTGIPNMYYFRKKAIEVLSNEGIDNKLFLFIDIANFKAFNEKYGYDIGSELIISAAKLVKNQFEGDLYARYSDDHFVVLTNRDNIEERLDILAKMLEEQHSSTRLSLKVGSYAPKSAELDPSIACDHARYASSIIKKNYDLHYCEYDDNMDDDFHKRQYIVTHIDDAVNQGFIEVYYQPVVWADNHSICGVEALARWIDPTYGFLSPAEFIPALEEYRLIHKLDQKVLEIVCLDINNGIKNKSKIVPVSVNFSRLDFELFNVKESIENLTSKYNVPSDMLHIEITESALTANDEKLMNTVQLIKNLGIELWLDDFGSGYSSLNVLKDYTFDVMKIDMVFLQRINENEKSRAILNSIVTMASLINMETLTEGVETNEQADFLKEIGCKRLQGYLFGKPMPIRDLRSAYKCF
ncbi:MAG: EAL domain-containing protein, partial [Lachnospiraceae bacterium]|nr:EAL domain-containing protein [Lachnospiraceae bacterium]